MMSLYLQHSLVGGMFLQLNQAVQNDQLHIVIALLNDQVNITLSCSLNTHTIILQQVSLVTLCMRVE